MMSISTRSMSLSLIEDLERPMTGLREHDLQPAVLEQAGEREQVADVIVDEQDAAVEHRQRGVAIAARREWPRQPPLAADAGSAPPRPPAPRR